MKKDFNKILSGINGNIDAAKKYFDRIEFNNMPYISLIDKVLNALENSGTITEFSDNVQNVTGKTSLSSKIILLYNISELLEKKVDILQRNETPVLSKSRPTSNVKHKSVEESEEKLNEKKDMPVEAPSEQTNGDVFTKIQHIELVLELYRYALRALEITT